MNTSSIGFPNMFDISRNSVSQLADSKSVASRVKLLILTNPTELYMNPSFGVGLKKFMFQYNNDNVVAQIRDRIIEQLRLWEPCVDADSTTVVRGLQYSGRDMMQDNNPNRLLLTVTIRTIYGETVQIGLEDGDLA